MKYLTRSLFLMSAILLSGCASIVSKSDYPISIGSVPSDAEVTITNTRTGEMIHRGRTPMTLTLSASDGYFQPSSYRVEVRKDGHYETTRTVQARLDGWYVGNIVFGGLIGWLIVDPLTGAMFRLAPGELNVELQARDEDMAGDDKLPALRVMSFEDVPEDMRGSLIRIN